jgi:hypothetical protein
MFTFVAVVVSVSAIPTLPPSSRPTISPSLSPSSALSTSTPSGAPTPISGRDLIMEEGLACLAFLEAIPALGTLTG